MSAANKPFRPIEQKRLVCCALSTPVWGGRRHRPLSPPERLQQKDSSAVKTQRAGEGVCRSRRKRAMREAQDQPTRQESKPQGDPRVETLLQAYRSLAAKVDRLQERIQEQEKQSTRIAEALEREGERDSRPATSPQQGESAPPQETEERRLPPGKSKKTGRAGKILGEIAFYGALLLLLLAALFIRTTGDGSSRSFAGYSGMLVLTESMESEIPKGSLVIAKQVDPGTLQIGDDITYMANQTTSVTHRIVGILENYQGSGQRAFETQGLMNAQPDKQPVPAVNVVGKVIFHSQALGIIARFIGDHWPLLLFGLVVEACCSAC